MKKALLFLNLFLFLNYSCSKDEEDIIQYVDINPDKEIQTVKYFSPSPITVFNCEDIPTPTDSTSTYYLDIDNDSDNDFIITVSHVESEIRVSHCTVYIYSIRIDGVSVNESAAISDIAKSLTKQFNENDTIDEKNLWSKSSFLLYKSIGLSIENDFSDCYIGVKSSNHHGYIKVGKLNYNGIIIEEYAINKTKNNNIICGQKI